MSIRSLLSQHLSLKIASIVAAIILWLVAKGEQSANREFTLPLIVRNIPEGLTTVERMPETVRAVLSGANKELLRLDIWGEPFAAIDLSGAEPYKTIRVAMSDANVYLPRDSGVRVEEVRDPKVLDIEIDLVAERRLAVIPVLANRLVGGYYVLGQRCVPDSVDVRGPASIVELLSAVRTVPLSLAGRNSRIEVSRAVDVGLGINVHAIPKEVRIIVEVEGTMTSSLEAVPVGVMHEPGGTAVVSPACVTVGVSGPEHVVSALTPADVRVYVDARGLPRGLHELVPETVLPDDVEATSVAPAKLSVTVR